MKGSVFYRVAAVLLLLFAVAHTLGFSQSDPKWAARRAPGSDFGAHARHRVGVRPLLWRHHGCELEIPFYLTYRFLNRDHRVFDFGCVACSEAGFHASIAIAR